MAAKRKHSDTKEEQVQHLPAADPETEIPASTNGHSAEPLVFEDVVSWTTFQRFSSKRTGCTVILTHFLATFARVSADYLHQSMRRCTHGGERNPSSADNGNNETRIEASCNIHRLTMRVSG